MRVLAIDPGERVGWATGTYTKYGVEDIERGVTPLKPFALKLGGSFGNYEIVIYETWRLYPEMGKRMVGNDMQPSQLVGMIRYIGWLNPTVRLISQGASIKKTAMKTMPEDLKESLGRSSEQHDQDAIMHLWYYWWFTHVAKAEA